MDVVALSQSERFRLAAGKGQLNVIKELLNKCVICEPDKDGRTLLHIAAQNGHTEVVRLLISRGFDIGAQDKMGYLSLHRASAQGHYNVVELLLKSNCPIDKQDECGNVALHAAAWNGYSQTLELLIRYEADVTITNKASCTALHSAAQKGHNQCARVLLYAGCHPDAKNNYGETALHTATRYGHAGVVQILISAKCKVNIQSKNGDSALHVAAMCKRHKIAKLLVDAGIKKKLKNKQHETALDIAKKSDCQDIVLVIKSKEKGSLRKHASEDFRKSDKHFEEVLDTRSDQSVKPRNCKIKQEKEEVNRRASRVLEVVGPVRLSHSVPEQMVTSMSVSSTTASGDKSPAPFSANMNPELLLNHFRDHQMQRLAGAPAVETKVSTTERKDSAHKNKKEKRVKGLLSEYTPKAGTQYFRDLAGNLKEGPVGYAPVTEFAPVVKKLEKKIEADYDNLYEHIESTKNILSERISTVDRKCRKKISRIDRRSLVPMDGGPGDKAGIVNNSQSQKNLADSGNNVLASNSRIKSETQLNRKSRPQMKFQRSGTVGEIAFVHDERRNMINSDENINDLYGCKASRGYWNDGAGNRDVDENRYNQYPPGTPPPPPGKLYRSKSDETISTCSGRRGRHKQRRTFKETRVEDKYWTLSGRDPKMRQYERQMRFEAMHPTPHVHTTADVENNNEMTDQFGNAERIRNPKLKLPSENPDFDGFMAPENTPQGGYLATKMSDGKQIRNNFSAIAGDQIRGYVPDDSDETITPVATKMNFKRQLISGDTPPSASSLGPPLLQSSPLSPSDRPGQSCYSPMNLQAPSSSPMSPDTSPMSLTISPLSPSTLVSPKSGIVAPYASLDEYSDNSHNTVSLDQPQPYSEGLSSDECNLNLNHGSKTFRNGCGKLFVSTKLNGKETMVTPANRIDPSRSQHLIHSIPDIIAKVYEGDRLDNPQRINLNSQSNKFREPAPIGSGSARWGNSHELEDLPTGYHNPDNGRTKPRNRPYSVYDRIPESVGQDNTTERRGNMNGIEYTRQHVIPRTCDEQERMRDDRLLPVSCEGQASVQDNRLLPVSRGDKSRKQENNVLPRSYDEEQLRKQENRLLPRSYDEAQIRRQENRLLPRSFDDEQIRRQESRLHPGSHEEQMRRQESRLHPGSNEEQMRRQDERWLLRSPEKQENGLLPRSGEEQTERQDNRLLPRYNDEPTRRQESGLHFASPKQDDISWQISSLELSPQRAATSSFNDPPRQCNRLDNNSNRRETNIHSFQQQPTLFDATPYSHNQSAAFTNSNKHYVEQWAGSASLSGQNIPVSAYAGAPSFSDHSTPPHLYRPPARKETSQESVKSKSFLDIGRSTTV